MKNRKVKVNGSAPKDPPKAVEYADIKGQGRVPYGKTAPAPMAGDKPRKMKDARCGCRYQGHGLHGLLTCRLRKAKAKKRLAATLASCVTRVTNRTKRWLLLCLKAGETKAKRMARGGVVKGFSPIARPQRFQGVIYRASRLLRNNRLRRRNSKL
jgi:hypothetical protein